MLHRPFVKVIAPGGYDFGEPTTQLVKVASTGLRGFDLKSLIKRAGHQFADAVQRLDLQPGDVPVHLIAMGSTEDYGPNRNGDGFKRAACNKYHDTFVKFSRWYRNHANKDPLKSYGYVKFSSFNDRMKRIELLAMLNGTKEAADRNKGLLADEELQKLASGDDIPVSMACKVPFDVCSGCGNRARNRDEYCMGINEGGLCKAGGLKHKIATFTGDDDNPILHADNPDPLFFDISKVIRPADRIAYTLGQLKAAGAMPLGGAALAEEWGVTAPIDLEATGTAAELLKLARRLAEIEVEVEKRATDRWHLAFTEPEPTCWTDHDGRLGDVLQALAREKIAMPLEGFLQLVGRDTVKAANAAIAAKPFLPGIYNRLLDSGEIHTLIETMPFLPTTDLAPLSVRRWAQTKTAAYSLNKEAADTRVMRAAIYCEKIPSVRTRAFEKSAGAALEVAKHYAMYKLAFLHAVQRQDQDLDLTSKLCVVQNYV